MGCSSSVQTHVKEKSRLASKIPDPDGLQKGDANLPIADENDTIPDQTKLGAIDEVEPGSPGRKQSESLAKEVADVLIPGLTNCALSTCQRVDPEGTEPQPVAVEEKLNASGPYPASFIEAGELQYVKPVEEEVSEPLAVHEAANNLPPEIVENNMPEPVESSPEIVQNNTPEPVESSPEIVQNNTPEPVESSPEIVQNNTPEPVESSQEDPPEPVAEEIVTLVTEIVKELEADEVELLTEGETGEKMETEKHCEIVSECSETKEEMGEATASAATEIEVTNEE
ncbi:glutamate-rich protein 5 [Anolis carolinensis]|uniref:glutamate-rich protein 5 n=1 Tax=Anolis carolinensis TaxID=28377 RepID=UPI002F2B2EF9